jgi:erythronate-4-phosphate dehydrogenase
MKIVIDENIAFAREAFSPFGNVVLCHGRKISNEILKEADALIVRSITSVNASLLAGTSVRFVGSATIGTDHIDQEYLQQQHITFADAKGCNADAVTDYIFTAIFRLLHRMYVSPDGMTLGIVGCGNIGGRIARIAPRLGFTVLKNDPPLARLSPESDYVSLETALRADIITIHTPLNRDGIDKTAHLFSGDVFERMPNCKIFLNASRGEVVETVSARQAIQNSRFRSVFDVWEHEPAIDDELLSAVDFASPHVAGYSYEGKVNGTVMMHDALCRHLGVKRELHLDLEPVGEPDIYVTAHQSFTAMMDEITHKIYSIEKDTATLKTAALMPAEERGRFFDQLRKEYHLRREFKNFTIHLAPFNADFADKLRALRFTVAG